MTADFVNKNIQPSLLRSPLFWPGLLLALWLASAPSLFAAESKPVRFLLHGGYGVEPPGEDYLRFVEQVKPDVLIVGVFDQRFYASASPPQDASRRIRRHRPANC